MKYKRPHLTLLYSFSLAVIIISFFLIEFATPYVINAYYAHWAALIIVLILAVSPLGNKKLVQHPLEKPHYAFKSWLLRLFALQISLFFVFLGIALIFSHWLVFSISSHPIKIYDALNIFLKHDGLFPWALYASYAAGFGYLSYIKNQDAYPSTLLSPLFKRSQPEQLLGIVLNLQARSALFSVLATTFAFITLLIAVIITPRTMPLLTGFHAKTMIIVLALVMLSFTPFFKKMNKTLLTPKIPLFITIMSTLIFFALLIWLLNALFGHLGEQHIHISGIVQWLERKNPNTLWIVFSAAWWIGWTPLMAGHIAKLSRGYHIRSMMLATLALPLIFTVFIVIFPNLLNVFQNFPTTISIISIIAFIYLLYVLTKKTALPMMIRSYLPKGDSYKHRDHYFYFRNLFKLMVIVIYLYLPTGISLTVFLVFTLTLSFSLQILLGLIALLLTAFRR